MAACARAPAAAARQRRARQRMLTGPVASCPAPPHAPHHVVLVVGRADGPQAAVACEVVVRPVALLALQHGDQVPQACGPVADEQHRNRELPERQHAGAHLERFLEARQEAGDAQDAQQLGQAHDAHDAQKLEVVCGGNVLANAEVDDLLERHDADQVRQEVRARVGGNDGDAILDEAPLALAVKHEVAVHENVDEKHKVDAAVHPEDGALPVDGQERHLRVAAQRVSKSRRNRGMRCAPPQVAQNRGAPRRASRRR